jgi:hypothetical protein
MLAAITDFDGRIVGVNRTWLDVERLALADLDAPRKVLGVLLGHGIRFGRVTDRLLAGEGIETVLSLRSVLPELPMVSVLTANHLAALVLPSGVAQLVIARDNDAAGVRAAARLRERAEAQGLVVHDLVPSLDDFNDICAILAPRSSAGRSSISSRASCVDRPIDHLCEWRPAECAGRAGRGAWSRGGRRCHRRPSPWRSGNGARALLSGRSTGGSGGQRPPSRRGRNGGPRVFSPARPPHATARVGPRSAPSSRTKKLGPAILR